MSAGRAVATTSASAVLSARLEIGLAPSLMRAMEQISLSVSGMIDLASLGWVMPKVGRPTGLPGMMLVDGAGRPEPTDPNRAARMSVAVQEAEPDGIRDVDAGAVIGDDDHHAIGLRREDAGCSRK